MSEEIRPGETESRVIADNTRTTCASPQLPSRMRGYGPPYWPTVLASAAFGVGAAFLARLALPRRLRPQIEPTAPPPGEIRPRTRPASPFYWIGTIALFLFGFLAIFSIGVPLLVLGIALIVLAPYRPRPAIFWPPLVVIVVFFVAFILTAPLYCSVTSGPVLPGGSTGPGAETCSSILLPDTSGPPPSVVPYVVIAAVAGAVGGVVTRFRLNSRHRNNAASG